VRFAATVKDFDTSPYLSPKDTKKMDTFIHYGIAAACQAIEDAGLEVTEANAERIGVAIGSGIGGLPGIEKTHESFMKSGPRRISPFFVPSCIINMISGNLSIKYGFKGPNIAIVTACTTGTHNIGDALHHRHPQHRRRRAHHRLRRRRRDGRRRRRDGHLPDRPGRVRRGARSLDPQRRPRGSQPPVGRRPRRLRAR
jgi:hypothetical protein